MDIGGRRAVDLGVNLPAGRRLREPLGELLSQDVALRCHYGISGPANTPVTLTLGFDDVGLLRFADVEIASSVASTLVQQFGTAHFAAYHYTMSVNVISGEQLTIDVPKNIMYGSPIDTSIDTP